MDYPADWEVLKAGELVTVIRGVSYKESDVHCSKLNNDCMILRGGNILEEGNINIIADDNVYIRRSLVSEAQFLKKNDVIIVASTASMKVIGKSGIIDDDYNNVAPGAFLLLIRPIQNKNIFIPYLSWYFRTDLYRNNIKRLVAGGVIQNIKREHIANLLIPLPPLAEQKTIANTLETFDAHIKNLSNLIEKKKAIRDGALDDLMSGRTRLKGFSGEWEVKKLGEIFDVFAGGDVKKNNFSHVKTSKYQYEVFSNGINNKGLYGYTSKALYPANSLTVSARGTIGQAFYRDKDFDAVIRLLVLIPKNDNIQPKFYENYINGQIIFEKENTGVAQLTAPKIKDYLIPLPPLAEQKAIAETVTAFDDEIKALEAERDKITKIRDGAMNDLLTGKIRLKF